MPRVANHGQALGGSRCPSPKLHKRLRKNMEKILPLWRDPLRAVHVNLPPNPRNIGLNQLLQHLFDEAAEPEESTVAAAPAPRRGRKPTVDGTGHRGEEGKESCYCRTGGG
jgi:hypothetical protein